MTRAALEVDLHHLVEIDGDGVRQVTKCEKFAVVRRKRGPDRRYLGAALSKISLARAWRRLVRQQRRNSGRRWRSPKGQNRTSLGPGERKTGCASSGHWDVARTKSKLVS
jgi:hypothetical protein